MHAFLVFPRAGVLSGGTCVHINLSNTSVVCGLAQEWPPCDFLSIGCILKMHTTRSDPRQCSGEFVSDREVDSVMLRQLF